MVGTEDKMSLHIMTELHQLCDRKEYKDEIQIGITNITFKCNNYNLLFVFEIGIQVNVTVHAIL